MYQLKPFASTVTKIWYLRFYFWELFNRHLKCTILQKLVEHLLRLNERDNGTLSSGFETILIRVESAEYLTLSVGKTTFYYYATSFYHIVKYQCNFNWFLYRKNKSIINYILSRDLSGNCWIPGMLWGGQGELMDVDIVHCHYGCNYIRLQVIFYRIIF